MRYTSRGGGMTKRRVALVDSAKDFDELFGNFRPTFDYAVADWEEAARALLDGNPQGGDTGEDDEPAGYARRLLKLSATVRSAIQSGNADEAARYSLQLGELIAEWSMKARHEPTWLTGDKQRRALLETRTVANAKRHGRQAEKHRQWQRAADEIWRSHPGLSKNRVAALVRQCLGVVEVPKTIAQRLKNPPKAG